MSELKLQFATIQDKNKIKDYIEEFKINGEMQIPGGAAIETYEHYEHWLQQNVCNRRLETVQEGFVPASTFLALSKQDHMIGCKSSNTASMRTILANGGKLEKEFVLDGEGMVQVYWIELV